MPKVSYVNGAYVNHSDAFMHIEDRGSQFADGVYEVMVIHQRKIIEEKLHFERLERSLQELGIPNEYSPATISVIIKELLRRNLRKDGMLYLQITRGVAPRNHGLLTTDGTSLVMTLSPLVATTDSAFEQGTHAITIPDIRWLRRDIKSISLLPNVLGKQAATKADAGESILVTDKGIVTEGSSTNVFIVNQNDQVITHPANELILNGITRIGVLHVAKQGKIKCEERPFTKKEMLEAKEVFITSTTKFILPVTKIDKQVIGSGKPGKTTTALRKLYNAYVEKQVAA